MIRFAGKLIRFIWRKNFGGPLTEDLVYAKWRRKNMPGKHAIQLMRDKAKQLKIRPNFSIILVLENSDLTQLKEIVDSITNQIYTEFELIISIPYFIDQLELPIFKTLNKIENVHLLLNEQESTFANQLNASIEASNFEYLLFLNQKTLLEINTLFEFASLIVKKEDVDLIYSDNDQINEHGRYTQPYFKPQWSPDTFLTRNFIGNSFVVKSSLLKEIGGFNSSYEGAEMYEMLLRFTEKTAQIYRVPKVLYHNLITDRPSISNELITTNKIKNKVKALNDTLIRRKILGSASLINERSAYFRIKYELTNQPKISIIIPTKNNSEVLTTCIDSIFELTNYPNFEVIIINNNSDEAALFSKFEEWKSKYASQLILLDCPYPFNYSKLMNDGVAEANGEYILLLNNDTEVLNGEWINDMLRFAQLQTIGAVGVKLLYHNNTVQHAGVVIGIGGVAGHTYVAAEKEEVGVYGYLSTAVNYCAVTAACLLVDKRKYLEVDGFDETLSIEYNDVDFCLKLIEKGYYNLFNPEVILYHYESLTRGHPYAKRSTYKRHLSETKYFKSKWQKYIDDDPFYNPNLSLITTHFEPNINM